LARDDLHRQGLCLLFSDNRRPCNLNFLKLPKFTDLALYKNCGLTCGCRYGVLGHCASHGACTNPNADKLSICEKLSFTHVLSPLYAPSIGTILSLIELWYSYFPKNYWPYTPRFAALNLTDRARQAGLRGSHGKDIKA
jgi:hypothetical protein